MIKTKSEVGLNEEIKVSFFENVTAKNNVPVSLCEVFAMIQNGHCQGTVAKGRLAIGKEDWKSYDTIKKTLPCFTPSGVFSSGHSKKELEIYNPLVILDIDKVGLNEAAELRKKASEMPTTYAAFVSPSGRGLKILVKTDSIKETHESAFEQVSTYYRKALDIPIDKSGKDFSRLCFVPFDPDIYVNDESEIYQIKSVTVIEEKAQTTAITNRNDKIFKKAEIFTNNKSSYREGNRNNHIHLLACNCNRFGLDKNSTSKMVLSQYKGLPTKEIIDTIYSAYSNTEEHGQNNWESTKTQDSVTFPERDSTMVWPIHELIKRNQELPPYNFIWHGIKEGSFGYIYGPPKLGKTTFCENLGFSIAAGYNSFLGYPIDQTIKRKVLFVGMEEFWRNRTERNEKQIKAMEGIDAASLPYLAIAENFPSRFNSEDDWKKLQKIIREDKPDVVFIDSMTRAVKGEIEDSTVSGEASFKLRELVKKFNITLIVIHHTTKLNGDIVDIDKLAGSRVIGQEADFLYGLYKVGESRYIKEVANRYKAEDENVIEFKINENQWIEKIKEVNESNMAAPCDLRNNPANQQLVLDSIYRNTSEEEKSVKTRVIVNELKNSITESEIYRYMMILANQGKLIRSRGIVSRP